MDARPSHARTLIASITLANLLLVAAGAAGGCARRVERGPAATAPAYDAEALARIKSETMREFPDVDHVTTQIVEAWMDDGRPLVLLDVRELEEFSVSHLRAARQVDPESNPAALRAGLLADVSEDARIVAYCSVGVRSARLAQRLQGAGFSDVHNLAGSIFEWANEGRPVYRGGDEVFEVHPFDEQWGCLLDAARHPD